MSAIPTIVNYFEQAIIILAVAYIFEEEMSRLARRIERRIADRKMIDRLGEVEK
jgi:hypothetical protein